MSEKLELNNITASFDYKAQFEFECDICNETQYVEIGGDLGTYVCNECKNTFETSDLEKHFRDYIASADGVKAKILKNSGITVEYNGITVTFWITGSASSLGNIEDVESQVKDVLDQFGGELMSEVNYDNYVYSGNLGTNIKLNQAYMIFTGQYDNAEYEPQQFPALKVNYNDESKSVQIFGNGNIKISTYEGREDAEEIYNTIRSTIEEYEDDLGHDIVYE